MSGYERENGTVLNREWRRSCDVSRQVVPYRGAGRALWLCDCRLWIDERSEPDQRSRRDVYDELAVGLEYIVTVTYNVDLS